MTQVNVLPIGIGKDRMEQHVIKGFAAHRDLQRIHDYEIKRQHVTSMMNLREFHFLLDTVPEFPTLHAALE